MVKYILSYSQPNRHVLDIEMIISDNTAPNLKLCLPIWRPGRYEEGNFAKNIITFHVFDKKGNKLNFHKTNSSEWLVDTYMQGEIHVKYSFYCAKLDAGSCWLDEEQLYVNPILCFLYVAGSENKPVKLELHVPKDYKVACALKVEKGNVIKAPDYHTMVDSPFIASPTLKHSTYKSNGITFHLWFQGEMTMDLDKIKRDFIAFTDEEIGMFGSFPAKEYHFFFQIMPMDFHHGVEHQASTVIAMGPSYELMNKLYDDFLGISSHELFHAWNVKNFRPKEMTPYNYAERNFSKLGYVYEGITTYYGNLVLLRSGVFDENRYFNALNDRIQKHYHNYGRFNQTVTDASYDTWLDGYVDGAPHRKTNIYTEGCVVALLLDLSIRMFTKDKHSLDDVMKRLYDGFGKNKNIGYSDSDFVKIVSDIAGCSFQNFFDAFVYGTQDTQPILEEVLSHIGCEISINQSKLYHENCLGFKLDADKTIPTLKIIAPNSPAEKAGLCKDDEIIGVNGWKIENNFDALCNEKKNVGITLNIFSKNKLKTIFIKETMDQYYGRYSVIPMIKPTKQQVTSYIKWSKSSN